MKYLISFFLLTASAASANTPEQHRELVNAMASSFYTGCIQGFLVSIEQGWYVRPKGKTAKEVVESLKRECHKAQKVYRKELQ